MGWGSSSDDYDDDDAGTFGADEIGGGTSSAGGGDNRDDGGSVDRVAVVSPNTGRVNLQNFNTSAAQTAGMNRVNVNGQTVAVAPSALNAVASGIDSGDSRISQAIQSQIVGPAQAAAIASSPVSLDYYDDRYYPSTVPVTRRSPVSVDNPNYVPLARDYTQADLAKAQRGLEEAKSEAYKEKQFGFDFGPLGGPMGMYERIADALFDPTASVANAIAERGFRTYDGQAVPTSAANYNRFGLDVATAGGLLSEGGRVAAYDPRSNVVYDTIPFSGLNPFGEGVPSNIQELYNRRNQFEEEQRARNDGGDQPLIVPQEVAEVDPVTGEPTQFPTHTPRKYEYQPFVSKFYTIPSRFTQPYGLLG